MVDIVRSHLAPINECAVLAHSYGREHFHFNAVGLPPAPRALLARDATEVAYALRYLELLEGTPRSRWAALMSAAQPAA
jgi:hypothetical protein